MRKGDGDLAKNRSFIIILATIARTIYFHNIGEHKFVTVIFKMPRILFTFYSNSNNLSKLNKNLI